MELENKIKELENSKPKQNDFPSKEEYEEAYGYWMMRQGQSIPMLRNLLKGSPQKQKSME